MAIDVKVQRGTTLIASSGTTVTITAGVDYTAPSTLSSAFCRVVTTTPGMSSVGVTGSTFNGSAVSATVDDSAITTSIVFTRGASPAIACRIDWEIVEYVGAAGGPHEFIVRGRGRSTFVSSSNTFTTSAISGVVTDADMLPWVTGTSHAASDGTDFARNMCTTAAWDAGGDTITLTRVRANTVAIIVSWAAVEYTGASWVVQVAEAGITTADSNQSLTIAAVGNITRAFLHTQQRGGSGDSGEDSTYQAHISSTTAITLYAEIGYIATLTVRCWVLENTQTSAGAMVVARYSGTNPGGATFTKAITSVGVMADASVVETSGSLANTSSVPNQQVSTFKMTSATEVTGFRSRAVGTQNYRFATVVWPGVPGPTINTQPVAQTCILSNESSKTWTIAATTSGGALSYQWKFDGVNVGTNSASYTRTGIVLADTAKNVRCDVTDSNGTTVSANALLTVVNGVTRTSLVGNVATFTSDYSTQANSGKFIRTRAIKGAGVTYGSFFTTT